LIGKGKIGRLLRKTPPPDSSLAESSCRRPGIGRATARWLGFSTARDERYNVYVTKTLGRPHFNTDEGSRYGQVSYLPAEQEGWGGMEW